MDLYKWYSHGFEIDDFGQSGQGLNVHAWLTLPSGEILDFTLLSTLAAALPNQWGQWKGHVLGGYPAEVLNGHRYVPMVLGDLYAERVNENSPVPMLAVTTAELQTFPKFLAVTPITELN